MTVLFIALPVALLLGLVFLAAFLWANHSGQFDDLKGPAVRVLHDEDDEQ